MRQSIAVFLLVAVAAIPALTAFAGPTMVPTGLSPGDQYRLAFVTSTSQFLSFYPSPVGPVSDFNGIVTGVAISEPALSALGTTWSAIVSTDSFDAINNTSTNPAVSVGVPIYNLSGALVAATNQVLWGTETNLPFPNQNGPPLSNPIDYDEHGQFEQVTVITATSPMGTFDRNPFGFPSNLAYGFSIETNYSWAAGGYTIGQLISPLYAMSGVLTVPTPESSATVLACLAAAGIALPTLRRRRHQRRRLMLNTIQVP